MGMVPPKGYLAVGSSMQKLPGGAMAVLHSLQQPNLTSVLQDEPDMAGCATSDVRLSLAPGGLSGSPSHAVKFCGWMCVTCWYACLHGQTCLQLQKGLSELPDRNIGVSLQPTLTSTVASCHTSCLLSCS